MQFQVDYPAEESRETIFRREIIIIVFEFFEINSKNEEGIEN
jgi:hypothetical protein